jgi:hypothetical protein
MPSDDLKLVSICAYLTDTSLPWRNLDHKATKMVKALKGEAINGYFEHEIAGKLRRFDQTNIQEFLARIPRALASTIARHVSGNAILVPIPNAHVTKPDEPRFPTLALAQAVARESRGNLSVVPALVFSEAQVKSREGGPRSPHHFESAYRIARPVTGPLVLLDDVCTTGGHMIGAYWKLHEPPTRRVVLACAFGRTTKEQLENPVGIREEQLNTARAPF